MPFVATMGFHKARDCNNLRKIATWLILYAIKSHADYLPDCPRLRPIEKALYACDELAGLIMATAILRPSGLSDLTASSVKKKMKAKGFARSINRDDIERGAADFGVELAEHIQFEIDAMKTIASELGPEGKK